MSMRIPCAILGIFFYGWSALGMSSLNHAEVRTRFFNTFTKAINEDANARIVVCFMLEEDNGIGRMTDESGHSPLWHAVTRKSEWGIRVLLDYEVMPDFGAFSLLKTLSPDEQKLPEMKRLHTIYRETISKLSTSNQF